MWYNIMYEQYDTANFPGEVQNEVHIVMRAQTAPQSATSLASQLSDNPILQ